MNEPSSVGVDEVPPYAVACLEVIAAIRDGERFVVAEDGHGKLTLLEPGLCPQCPFATLLVDPPEAGPVPCS